MDMTIEDEDERKRAWAEKMKEARAEAKRRREAEGVSASINKRGEGVGKKNDQSASAIRRRCKEALKKRGDPDRTPLRADVWEATFQSDFELAWKKKRQRAKRAAEAGTMPTMSSTQAIAA